MHSAIMVKATAEARIEIKGGPNDGVIFKKFSDSIDFSPRKLSLKRLLFPLKGRRKDAKDPSPDGSKQYLEEEFIVKRIENNDFVKLVEKPPHLDYNEWLATNIIAFFENLNLVYGAVSEFCTTSGCAAMNGPNNIQYQWVDDKGKKCRCAAPQYTDYVMLYAHNTVYDEGVFPTKYGNVFPVHFETTVKKIVRLLLHVLAHLYHAHFKELLFLALHGHVNTYCLHFIMFNRKFNLIEEKELEVLDDLYRKLLNNALNRKSDSSHSNSACSSASASQSPSCERLSDNKDGLSTLTGDTNKENTEKENLVSASPSLPGDITTLLEENKENLKKDQAANGHPKNPSL